MKLSFALAAAISAFGTVVITVTSAEATVTHVGPRCGEFIVYEEQGDDRTIVIDHAEPGVGPGDVRVNNVRLVDDEGEEIGRIYVHAVIAPGDNDGFHMLLGTGYYVFEDGVIIDTAPFMMADPANSGMEDMVQEGVPPEIHASVIGGHGAYAGALGTFRAYIDDSGRRVHEFDIVCME